MSKHILINGASSGIGAACAEAAVAAGHRVSLAARSTDKLNDLVDKLGADNALAVECDVTQAAQQEAMLEAASEKFGSLDVVYANAGIGASASGTEEGEIDNFKDMIMVNNFAVTITCKLAIPYLKESKGNLVLTGSQAGHMPLSGSVYGATKWFVRGYANNLSSELKDFGIRVSCIDPGMVETPFFDDPNPDALHPDDIARAFIYIIEQPQGVRVARLQVYPMM